VSRTVCTQPRVSAAVDSGARRCDDFPMPKPKLTIVPPQDPLNGQAAREARARRLERLARHPEDTPAPASVIRALLPVLGVSETAMRPTAVPIPRRPPRENQ
jgi:hypothetical protein